MEEQLILDAISLCRVASLLKFKMRLDQAAIAGAGLTSLQPMEK